MKRQSYLAGVTCLLGLMAVVCIGAQFAASMPACPEPVTTGVIRRSSALSPVEKGRALLPYLRAGMSREEISVMLGDRAIVFGQRRSTLLLYPNYALSLEVSLEGGLYEAAVEQTNGHPEKIMDWPEHAR